MNVQLRKRKKGNKISLYIDYYQDGKRQYEYLGLYLLPVPSKGRLTPEQRNHNIETLTIAEGIRAKRYLEIQNGIYGLQDKSKIKASFIKYIEMLCEKRKDSKGNYGNWDSTLKHLRKFSNNDISFAQVDNKWLNRFKEYLETEAKTPSGTLLAKNSQCSYFNKVRAALKQAVKDEIILKNPGA